MDQEIWKDIPGYEGRYQASSLGRVKSLERVVDYGNTLMPKRSERVLKQYNHPKGYRLVSLYNGSAKNISVHRVIAMTFIPNPESLPQVNHKDFDKTNNTVANLEWCSGKQNMAHCVAGGRSAKGEKQYFSKLTEEKVLKIRKMRADGVDRYTLSKEFGISPKSITAVCMGNTWSHVGGPRTADPGFLRKQPEGAVEFFSKAQLLAEVEKAWESGYGASYTLTPKQHSKWLYFKKTFNHDI